MARPAHALSSSRAPSVRPSAARRLHGRPELRAAADADAGAVPIRADARRPSRSPMRRGGRSSTIPRCRRCQGSRSPATSISGPRRAGRGGARARRHRQVVPLSAGRRRRATTAPAGDQRRTGGHDRRTTPRSRAGTTASSCRGSSISSAGSGASAKPAVALVLATEQGRRGVLVTLVGDVATNYFLLRELDLQLEIARQTLELNDDTVAYFQQSPARAACRTGSSWIASRPTASRTAASIPRNRTADRASPRTLLSFLLGRPPGPIAARAAG